MLRKETDRPEKPKYFGILTPPLSRFLTAAFFALLFIAHPSNDASAQTDGFTVTEQTNPATHALYSVHFTDSNTGWAVGVAGTILHTTNGGVAWGTQTSGITSTLKSVHFTDVNNGWAVGADGTILHTDDGGGVSWEKQTNTDTNLLSSVHFTDVNNGWAVGDGGIILHTINGGTTWTKQDSISSSVNLHSVHFTDSTHGWAVGDGGGTILKISGPDIPNTAGDLTADLVKQLDEEILPRLVHAMLDSAMSAVNGRIDATFSGTPQVTNYQFDGQTVQLDSQTRLSANLQNTVQQKLPTYIKSLKDDTMDWKAMLSRSSFVMPLNAVDGDGSGAAAAAATIWGSGGYVNLSDKGWKGDVFSLQLGVDQRVRNDLLVGGLVSWSKGDVDYTLAGSGDYTHQITSVHPYMAKI